jgi:lipid-A-disaccharide synthase-like uncharacterized protein
MNGGRKYRLASQTFWAATLFATVAIILSLYRPVEVMPVLYWWTSTVGGLVMVYNGTNVLQKKVTDVHPVNP